VAVSVAAQAATATGAAFDATVIGGTPLAFGRVRRRRLHTGEDLDRQIAAALAEMAAADDDEAAALLLLFDRGM